LSFDPPTDSAAAFDQYVSDPAHPVPYRNRPIEPTYFPRGSGWYTWLLQDQRFVQGRPDVLSWVTDPLDSDVVVAGDIVAHLFASTTGSDADWVVKLIDVYPDEVPSQPEMGGYELPIAMDIFRGRYRESFEHPSAIPAGRVQRYRFTLPTVNHVFLPGHRMMVQIQSSWFPLYDRNPQSYVPNIFFAKPADYVKATQSIFRSGSETSAVWLPVVQ
jgi:uncharacterized protein